MTQMNKIEKWTRFELELQGPSSGNPFLDVDLSAEFRCADEMLKVQGFYDGNGTYRIRCMPTKEGTWTYTTKSNASELDGKTGSFTCTPAAADNHGPVYVHDTFHFAYADGTSYYPFGTTCYAWTHQGDAMEEQTLATLKEASFNKIRMCVFPKHYPFNRNEPVYYPYERDADGNSDFTRFNPEFWHHFEKRLDDLLELGIEADIIIWHPYDRWGYSTMDEESDIRYLRYLIARIGSFRHVWWSLANEYDFLLKVKPMELWDRFIEILHEEDPYGHLRSIHNGDVTMNYDHTKPGITHVCIQNAAIRNVVEWREQYGKPIVNDELEYEGNVPYPWGAISAEEEVHRFWIMVANGGYAGHGETYMDEKDELWWGKGGVLRGESWKRIGFLRKILEDGPAGGLTPQRGSEQSIFPGRMGRYFNVKFAGGLNGDYHLIYLGDYQHKILIVPLENDDYQIDAIDTWDMTISPVTAKKIEGDETYLYDMPQGENAPNNRGYALELPDKPHLALRFRK
ncbi:MAG: DUF5060 domain-containing protein [Trueperaceae bacterium]|nr:DUF5060 domain-containing protein [Trueperaceae bacterium]